MGDSRVYQVKTGFLRQLSVDHVVQTPADEVFDPAAREEAAARSGRILQRVGAHNVVYPEAEMGSRVAHLVTGQMLEFLALDDDFVLVEMRVPRRLAGARLGDTDLRAKYKVTVVCIKPQGGQFTYAERDTVLGREDLIVVAGHRRDVERFADRRR